MEVVWGPEEVGSPTPIGKDADTAQANFVLLGDGTKQKFPMEDAVLEIHRHLDGKLVRVMKTIVNAGKIEVHVDLPITEG